MYQGTNKMLSLPYISNPNFSAAFSMGTMFGFGVGRYDKDADKYKGELYFYGKYDDDVPEGLYRFLRFNSTVGDDVFMIPAAAVVSNLFYLPDRYGYANNVAGAAKAYLTTTEITDAGVPQGYFKTYKFNLMPTGVGSVLAGVYETQTQIFSKKVTVSEVRVLV